jgi:GT2 family glycosyltransferase
MPSLAILLTCHNRKETTLRCLQNLASCEMPPEFAVTVYLVDDASTDGTGDAVRAAFPCVHVLNGNGSLYWAGGMRLAFATAIAVAHDFYLWLNDDVELCRDALVRLVETFRCMAGDDKQRPAIVVGATRDPDTGITTSSGWRFRPWRPLKFALMEPDSSAPVACDTMNGNVVLVSGAVVERIGNIDPRFTHQIGDLDYGLRAKRAHIPIWLAPGFIGKCRRIPRSEKWKDPAVPLRTRWNIAKGPLGLPPREYIGFYGRHFGIWGVANALLAYRHLIWPPGGQRA